MENEQKFDCEAIYGELLADSESYLKMCHMVGGTMLL
jgi:hypothetical protein